MARQTKGPKSQNLHDSKAQAFDEADRRNPDFNRRRRRSSELFEERIFTPALTRALASVKTDAKIRAHDHKDDVTGRARSFAHAQSGRTQREQICESEQ